MRLRFPDRLAFWNRPPALDLSCISPEDWERLERASRGDERELTARIMLLAYLAKANGHSTFDSILPDDLTPEEANRLADQLTIGNGERNGAPGRRARIRLVQAPDEPRPSARRVQARRITRPAIFRLLEAVAVVLVGLALIALPFGLTAAPHLILLTITLAACAALTRPVAPGFSISYLLAAAAAAEGSLRTILPVDVYLGSGALIAMALWTRLLQPRFEAGPRLRGLAWSGIAASALTVIAAISLQVQTLPVWGPLVVGALACSVVRGPTWVRLVGPRVRFSLLAVSAVLIFPLALRLPNGDGALQFELPGVLPGLLLALTSVATAATLVWRRRHLLPTLPRLAAVRTMVADAGSLAQAATKALPVLLVTFGVVYAMCLVPLAPERIVSNFDMYWLTAAFGVASLLMLRREPLVAVLFACAGASYAESVLTSAINGWPELQLPFAAALGLWLLVGQQRSRIPAVRFLRRSAVVVTGLAWLLTLSGLALLSPVWILSMTMASVYGVHRAFEHGLMADPRLALAVAAFLPYCAELLLWTLGFRLPDYGTTYISFSNLWLSVGPIGCILHSLISASATNHTRIEHGST